MPVLFSGFHHRQSHSILDRAGRILIFQLHEQSAITDIESRNLNQRGVSDQSQDRRLSCLHRSSIVLVIVLVLVLESLALSALKGLMSRNPVLSTIDPTAPL